MLDQTQNTSTQKNAWLGLIAGSLIIISFFGGALADRLFIIKPLDYLAQRSDRPVTAQQGSMNQLVLNEESVVIDVAEKASPSVVTISIKQQRRQVSSPFFFDPFGLFFGQEQEPQETETIQQDIGTGFVVDGDQGLIVTNKHVVSSTNAEYMVITKDDQEIKVEQIYRDPVNDLAILKVDQKLDALPLGDSDQLKVGQFVIAIGTALGEFRHTVTTGVISGLGRGIIAGSGFGGFTEELDNVIQTDAAINPGNSGGPLLNSAGQVIGVNVAVAQGSENIGFAIPINTLKASLDNFEQTGQFDRPLLGVRYRMVSKEAAIANDVAAGALIVEVVKGSAAEEAGMKQGDIITKLAGKPVAEAAGGLGGIINTLKVGEDVPAEIFRSSTDSQGNQITETLTLTIKMKTAEQ